MTFILRCNHRRSCLAHLPDVLSDVWFNINSTFMKTKITVFVVPLILLCLSASVISEDIISRLGLDPSMAKSYLLANVTGGFNADFEIRESVFFYPRIKTLANIIAGDETGAAKELCQYIRDYVNSQEFLDEYNKKRQKSKPTFEPEPMNAESLESMRTSIVELETQLAELKKSPKENAQMITMFEPMVESQKVSLAEYEDPTPNKSQWEKNYPEDPAVLVKRRLQDYLDLVTTVDFNAQLTAPDKYNFRKFVNPAYEGKSAHWKACYRAGKEVNTEVTVFVKDWLAGEIIAANKTKLSSNGASAVQAGSVAETADQNAAPQNENGKEDTGQGVTGNPKEKTSIMGKLKKAKALIKE